jgi:ABC-type multidrug transport system fused ATPase/permease subunit
MCCDQFFRYLEDNTRVTFLINILNRWAALRFDWISIVFITLVTILAIVARIAQRHISAADIALTLTLSGNLMGLLQWTVRFVSCSRNFLTNIISSRQSVEVESQMTSVERILEYCELEQEPPAQLPPKYRPPTDWPSHGQIIFNDVCMSYSKDPDAPLALSHITLTIRPAEKVGIVGRTGAGKSSFIQTLFRMGTLVEGEIKIDNIDISTIGLDDVRRRISIIPQDPVLFTGTMRSNLDQFDDYSDAEIWHALEQVS